MPKKKSAKILPFNRQHAELRWICGLDWKAKMNEILRIELDTHDDDEFLSALLFILMNRPMWDDLKRRVLGGNNRRD